MSARTRSQGAMGTPRLLRGCRFSAAAGELPNHSHCLLPVRAHGIRLTPVGVCWHRGSASWRKRFLSPRFARLAWLAQTACARLAPKRRGTYRVAHRCVRTQGAHVRIECRHERARIHRLRGRNPARVSGRAARGCCRTVNLSRYTRVRRHGASSRRRPDAPTGPDLRRRLHPVLPELLGPVHRLIGGLH